MEQELEGCLTAWKASNTVTDEAPPVAPQWAGEAGAGLTGLEPLYPH